jgi:hypothetical protein
MPATQPSKPFPPLCYEHHAPLELSGRVVTSDGKDRESYACTKPECPVHYSDSFGYFIAGQSTNRDEPQLLPRVKCRQDGTPMYLAEIKAEKREFRLWRCPQCGATRTNGENLIGVEPLEPADNHVA